MDFDSLSTGYSICLVCNETYFISGYGPHDHVCKKPYFPVGTNPDPTYPKPAPPSSPPRVQGWGCPRCQGINAPFVQRCPCSPVNYTVT